MFDTAASDFTPTGATSRSTTWPLVAICVGYFMVILDTTVVNVALPSLSRGLRTSTTGLEGVVGGYSLLFAALLLSGGALADRRGAKAVFCAESGRAEIEIAAPNPEAL